MTDFVAVGHVAWDEFPDGATRLGGTALYAAATAARLGVPTALVTRVGPAQRDELSRCCSDLGIELHALASNVTTTFAFRWEADGRRVLRLRARAKGIALADVPAELTATRAVVFGSIAHELGRDVFGGIDARAAVLAAQGFLRRWDADGTVRPAPWPEAREVIRPLSAVVLSEDDIAGDTALLADWSTITPVVLTLAERGARLYEAGRAIAESPAYSPSRIVDTTGAGDAFAAGLAIGLAEGGDMPDAMGFANAVASFCLEGPGITGLATREAVEQRLRG
jgi:sugar/nucleoside kinase (ribokinase family)